MGAAMQKSTAALPAQQARHYSDLQNRLVKKQAILKSLWINQSAAHAVDPKPEESTCAASP
jgi:hypothetical protein